MEKASYKYAKKSPQMQVRTNLHGGESVEACENNIDYWKKIWSDNIKKAQAKH